MKAKVLITFKDVKEKKLRHPGEVFECSRERFEEILNVNKLVEEVTGDADGSGDASEAVDGETPDTDAKTARAAADDATGASDEQAAEDEQTDNTVQAAKAVKKAKKTA